jgi:hypothetical protein
MSKNFLSVLLPNIFKRNHQFDLGVEDNRIIVEICKYKTCWYLKYHRVAYSEVLYNTSIWLLMMNS